MYDKIYLMVDASVEVCLNLETYLRKNYPTADIRLVMPHQRVDESAMCYRAPLPLRHEVLGVTLSKLFGLKRWVPKAHYLN